MMLVHHNEGSHNHVVIRQRLELETGTAEGTEQWQRRYLGDHSFSRAAFEGNVYKEAVFFYYI